jgi:hypothetical protein
MNGPLGHESIPCAEVTTDELCGGSSKSARIQDALEGWLPSPAARPRPLSAPTGHSADHVLGPSRRFQTPPQHDARSTLDDMNWWPVRVGDVDFEISIHVEDPSVWELVKGTSAWANWLTFTVLRNLQGPRSRGDNYLETWRLLRFPVVRRGGNSNRRHRTRVHHGRSTDGLGTHCTLNSYQSDFRLSGVYAPLSVLSLPCAATYQPHGVEATQTNAITKS